MADCAPSRMELPPSVRRLRCRPGWPDRRVHPEQHRRSTAPTEVIDPGRLRPIAMDPELLALAHRTRGFMPDDEGLALYTAALAAARLGPIVEIGTYCGKSSIYLAAAARAHGTLLFTIDHHRGSEENQPGEQYHDPALADPLTGGLDSLPAFRRTMTRANLDDCLIAIIGRSEQLARHWHHPLGAVFIDGGHSE